MQDYGRLVEPFSYVAVAEGSSLARVIDTAGTIRLAGRHVISVSYLTYMLGFITCHQLLIHGR
jgi:hypothetical protein